MKVIFAKTRHHYDSYCDFWRLVDLSRFDTCFFDEVNFQDADAFYIFTPMNGEQPNHVANHPGRKCHLIWWCLERPDANTELNAHELNYASAVSKTVSEALQTVDFAWCSDYLIASLDSRFQFVPLGGHSGMRVHPSNECVFEFTHQSYAYGRREEVYAQLRHHGLREGPSCFGDQRERVLASSRLVLNLQQFRMPIVAPLRFAMAAAYELPIVTEKLHDHPLPLQSGDLIQAPYEKIVETVVSTLHRSDLRDLGRVIYHKYCVEWPFRRGVEEALSQIKRLL